ncbi:cytochrome P450 [Polyangium jinanense]|uniref:Cytochrome P450 n=1 Tax=Polyangium jinanense TaxID=2829994 RepID=A0A9X3WX83_9BACT|nr:cytochrome P450 [Polyangium jinanense]MDC3953978.1 cytochrome P450 [Polyangium jinanense]MDC3957809.1 cytochrome P450 [Polyangium jinanense]MDC3978895.1 cytochrome P450 [Polyangium jinanense]MDC3982066.1 cytochrome P450 [Polyangium jinanense]
MPPFSGQKLDTIPAHVPPELVYEYDSTKDPRMLEDPHARMRSLILEAPPIFFSPHNGGHWFVTRKQAIVDITMNPEVYSNALFGASEAHGGEHEAPKPAFMMLPIAVDPPQHTAYRAPLNQPLAAKSVAGLETAIRTMTNELIDKVLDAGRCDFLSDIAEPLPVTLFMKLAGMPTNRLAEFRELATQATSAAVDHATREGIFKQIAGILAESIKARQEKREDDLISRLLDANIQGRNPTFPEMLGYSITLFLGGLDTVVNALSFGVRHLARDQELQAKLRADPSLLPGAIEELLRLYGVACTPRRVTRDVVCHGVNLKQGDALLLLLPAANYDDAAFPNPEQFIMGRTEQHMTFNTGPHRCVGLNLARLEMKVFYQEWLKRVPPFRLDPQAPPRFTGGFNLAVTSLPLVWD